MKILKINSSVQRAEAWEDGRLVKSYIVSTAKNGLGCAEGSYCTPSGRLKVSIKMGAGLPLGAVFRSRVATGEVWPQSLQTQYGENEDLVLTRILWLEGAEEHNANTLQRYVYLHGTNQEHLLGTPASHGCIRFSNQDILEVFNFLNEGDEVEVV